MKKANLFYLLLTVFAVTMVFSSCGPKKTATTDSQEEVAKSRGVEPGTAAERPSDDPAPERGDADSTDESDNPPSGDVGSSSPERTAPYVCPSHCKGSGGKEAGKCPKCGKAYVVNDNAHGEEEEGGDRGDGDEDQGDR